MTSAATTVAVQNPLNRVLGAKSATSFPTEFDGPSTGGDHHNHVSSSSLDRSSMSVLSADGEEGGKTVHHGVHIKSYYGLWFSSAKYEELFLVTAFLETRFRYLILMIITDIALVGLYLSATNPTVVSFLTASVVYMSLATVGDAIVVLLTYLPIRKRHHITLARVHEVLSFLLFLYQVIFHSIYIRWRTGICSYVVHHEDHPVNDEDCPQLYLWSLFFQMTPLLIAQPRFFLTIVGLLFSMIFACVNLRFHQVTTTGTVSLLLIYITHLVFVGAMKFIFEAQQRRRFEAEFLLQRRLHTIRYYNDSLEKFVTQLAPKYLQSRLKSTTIQVDVSQHAVVVASRIEDAPKVINSMLPNQAAKLFAVYNHLSETDSIKYGLHLIRHVGDTNYFVSNLFATDHPTVVEAVLKAVQFAKASKATSNLAVCTGVAVGKMTGLPVGTTCIRYDVFGEPLREAQKLALICPRHLVRVSIAVLDSLNDLVDIVDAEQGLIQERCSSASANSSEASTISLPNSRGDLTSPRANPNADASLLSTSVETMMSSMVPAVEVVHLEYNNDAIEKELELDENCGILTHFRSKETEAQAATFNRRAVRSNFAFCNMFFALQCVFTIISAAEERHADMDRPMWVFFALMALSFIGFSGLGLRSLAALRSGHQHEQSHIWLFMILCLMALAGNNFSRPSAVGTSNAHFIWSTSFCVLFVGASIHQMLGFQVAVLAVYYATSILFRPVFIQMMLIAFVGTLVFAGIGIQHNKLQISLFTNSTKLEGAYTEEQELCRVREILQNSLIPPVVREKGTIAENLGTGYVRTWSNDTCVVVSVLADQDDAVVASLVDNPEALREYAESVTRLVEDIVPQLTNKTLSIVKVFGGVMTLAGPLFSDAGNVLTATEDAFELLQRLHIARANKKLSGQRSAGMTIAVAAEQVVNVLRLTEFPSYELMGPGVNTSRAMANACPAPMSVVTEKLTQLYQRECKPSPLLRIGDGESWRLRDMGVQRVCHVHLQEDVVEIAGGTPTSHAVL